MQVEVNEVFEVSPEFCMPFTLIVSHPELYHGVINVTQVLLHQGNIQNIIGPNANCLLKLSTDHHVTIRLNACGFLSDMIIFGSQVGCLGAKLAIEDLQKSLVKQTNVYVVKVPHYLHTLIFGPSGLHITKFNSRFNVNITVPDNRSFSDEISIKGCASDVKEACKYLKKLIDPLEMNIHHLTLRVEPDYFFQILGKNGTNLFRLSARHWVNVSLFNNLLGDNIRISGLKAHCQDAYQDLWEQLYGDPDKGHTDSDELDDGQLDADEADKLDRLFLTPIAEEEECLSDDLKTLTMQVDADLFLLAERHRNDIDLKLKRTMGVRFSIPKNQQGSVKLRGTAERCMNAFHVFREMFSNKKEVVVPQKLRSLIIGRRGNCIKKMSCALDVIINVPPKMHNSDVIYVMGATEEKVDAAVQALLARVDVLEKKELCTNA